MTRPAPQDAQSTHSSRGPRRRLRAIAIGLTLIVETATAAGQDRKTILAHTMVWYETPAVRSQWGSHWTGADGRHDPAAPGVDGLPDIASRCHPLIGPYDSTDSAVIECQLLEMKLAGIDGVIVDWYGIAEAADYPAIHAGARAMYAACGRLGLTFVACYEDRTVGWMLENGALRPEDVGGHLADTLCWMERDWFPGGQYLRVSGHPLVLVFGPISVMNPAAWSGAITGLRDDRDRPLVVGLHHLWRAAGFDGGFTWVHFEAWENGTEGPALRERLASIHAGVADRPGSVIASALPAYDDIYPQSYGQVPYREGATLRDSLAVCMAGPWPIVQLVTWNDYGEGTVIEPTHERGYGPLEIVLDARRREAGDASAVALAANEDLRLPQRLLAFRRSGGDPATAAAIAECLAAGRCRDARERLDEAHR